jgi:hypothetical protein
MQSKAIFAAAAAVLSSAGLSVFAAQPARAQATTIFFDDFDGNGTASWGSTQNVSTTDPGSLFGSNVYYFDGSKSSDRFAETPSLDLSAGKIRVTFVLRYEGNNSAMGDTGDVTEFDRLENSSDNLLLEYSTDGGSNWITLQTFDNASDTFRFGDHFGINLPSGAFQSSVLIRVFQSGSNVDSGRDQWAIDDFSVVSTPEPGTWALFGLGTAGLGAWAERRRRARRKKQGEPSRTAGGPPPGATAGAPPG